ncbi:FUSC family protein [Mucilaginibacter jinjuensis]|uniref:FUSC family membrane protein n=1 Tax=Mucilaginibacter jinjuensis TaxID=1176721 RepID=A0ABY7T0Y6_9SPHI|nr:FUSC family membrane protein [Mucilaginibacter jinjuensis]WCT10094.1 FUSC family membrane protein [Mucilaginibacter jinjuensis]
MAVPSREIKSFFFSQYFSDGLRITIGVLLPSLIFAQFNQLELGLTLSLGAICVCVVDTPGPEVYKRNAMLACNALLLLVSITTGFARLNVYTLGIEVIAFSFLFSMFTVYGNRAAAVGTSSLLVMIFMMDKGLQPGEVLHYSLLITVGGVWYMIMSLVFFGIRPYRAAQQALGENIVDVVKFLRIKADFYLPETDIEDNYKKLVSQQIKVSQHQDNVRELLFKTRLIVRESTHASRVLVLTFVDLVDMFEQIMATHYDYQEIRDRFEGTEVLPHIAKLVHQMAGELDNIGYAILANSRYRRIKNFGPDLENLKNEIDATSSHLSGSSNLVLKKILINVRDLNQKISDVCKYYNSKSAESLIDKKKGDVEYTKFVAHQDYTPHIFFDNLTFTSATFKHALRVALVCLTGFVITKSNGLLELINHFTGKKIVFGHHSYWVLLTIIVILKPGFSLSKQRNYQRVFGTIIGGAIGVLVLTFVHNKTLEVALLMVFMMGAYSFLRINYITSVIFMTPYVLILFRFLGVGHLDVAEERIIDTIIGSSIAFLASYLIFPSWESEQLRQTLLEVVDANIRYLMTLGEHLTGKPQSTTDYKLARKDVFVKSANLSAAFERMVSEPKSKQKQSKDVHKFVVLNHILSSYLATIASNITGASMLIHLRADNLKMLKRDIAVLNEVSKKLGGNSFEFTAEQSVNEDELTDEKVADQELLKEQLGFINKIANDIQRITDNLILQ